MKVILLQNISGLGKKGDIKEVSDGYARNFLFPKKIAEIATENAIEVVEIARQKSLQEEKNRMDMAQNTIKKIESAILVLRKKEKDGKLFGSITPKDIVSELKKDNLDITEKSIIIKEPIKNTGHYEVTIRLEKNLQGKLMITVEAEK